MDLLAELATLVKRSGTRVLDEPDAFRASLDDFLPEHAAGPGVINLLVDAVRQGAVGRALRDISHGAEPIQAIDAAGDQLSRDRATSDSGPCRWAVAVLVHAAGQLDRALADTYAAVAPPGMAQTSPATPHAATPAAPVLPQPEPLDDPELRIALTRPTAPRDPATSAASAAPAAPGTVATLTASGAVTATRPHRRGLRVGVASVAAVAAVAGAVLVLPHLISGNGDPAATDAGSPSSGVTGSGGASQSPVNLTDPAAFEAALRTAATPIMNSGKAKVSVTTWNAADLAGGVPRVLTGSERTSGTRWTIAGTKGGHHVFVSVNWLPTDIGQMVDPCGPGAAEAADTAPIDTELDGVLIGTDAIGGRSSCSDGEWWGSLTRTPVYGEWGVTQVHTVASGDGKTSPMVRVTEYWTDKDLSVWDHTAQGYSSVRNLEIAQRDARVTAGQMRAVATDAAVGFGRPAAVPGLPSYYACRFPGGKAPKACPSTITPAPHF